MDLYKKVIGDKGSTKKDTVNNPLTDYLLEEDEAFLGFLNTNVMPLNILFSGRVDGGIPLGKMSMISADSKNGKSIIAHSLIKSAQAKGMTTIVIDTEYAFDYKVAKAFGVDCSKEKLMVFQENEIERIRNIIAKIFDDLTIEERRNIFLVFDSWGGLLTNRTIDNALEGKVVKDMSESQLKNGLAGILNATKATCFVVNHVYANIGGFGDPLSIPGGKRLYFLSSSVVLVMSRAKEKDTEKEITGYILSSKTHKSRWSTDTTELQFRIKQNGGLDIFYGLLDVALEGGFIVTGDKKGTYVRNCVENDEGTKEINLYNSAFWLPIFKKSDFKKYIEKRFTYSNPVDVKTEDVSGFFDADKAVVEEPVEKKTRKSKKEE